MPIAIDAHCDHLLENEWKKKTITKEQRDERNKKKPLKIILGAVFTFIDSVFFEAKTTYYDSEYENETTRYFIVILLLYRYGHINI